MQLHELRPDRGSRKTRTRVGRGISAGQGKTAGRGQKGQFARSGASLPKGFEGGQMRLSQRLPKLRGFSNSRFSKQHAIINLSRLNKFEAGSEVGLAEFRAAGFLRKKDQLIKVLGEGELKVALRLKVNGISERARKAVEAAGGTVELLGGGEALAGTASDSKGKSGITKMAAEAEEAGGTETSG